MSVWNELGKEETMKRVEEYTIMFMIGAVLLTIIGPFVSVWFIFPAIPLMFVGFLGLWQLGLGFKDPFRKEERVERMPK